MTTFELGCSGSLVGVRSGSSRSCSTAQRVKLPWLVKNPMLAVLHRRCTAANAHTAKTAYRRDKNRQTPAASTKLVPCSYLFDKITTVQDLNHSARSFVT